MAEAEDMANVEDQVHTATMGTPGSVHEDLNPRKKKRGNQTDIDWDVFHARDVLAFQGWEGEHEPWNMRTAKTYVSWSHICRHWDEGRAGTILRAGYASISECRHGALRQRLTEVAMALWGRLGKKDGTLALCQMAYAETFLGKDVDWSTYPARPRNGQFPAKLRHVPRNPNVAMEGLPEDVMGTAADNPDMQMMEMEVELNQAPPVPVPNLTDQRNADDVSSDYVLRLQNRVNDVIYEKEELARKHANDLAEANERIQALENENAELRSQIAAATSQQRRLSIEVSPSALRLDDVIERASCGLVEEMVATPMDSAFTTRPRQLPFGGTPVASASTIELEMYKARAIKAEGEVQTLTTHNRLLKHRREEMMLDMGHMKLGITVARNESEQMQREVKKVAAQFKDGAQRYFGITSWPLVEELFPDDMPENVRDSSIDWNNAPEYGFQFETARYRYGDNDAQGNPVGLRPLLWPKVPRYVTDGSVCIMCNCPFGPEGAYSLGTCPHVYHPQCLIPYMVTRKRCAECKAPFHPRLYKMFGLENHMPLHYEYDEDNLPLERTEWGKDMVWMWKWSHDEHHLPVQTVDEFPWESDAMVTDMAKTIYKDFEAEKRHFFAELAGGHWDVAEDKFRRAPHPDGLVYNSNGEPVGIPGLMEPEAQIEYIQDQTFHQASVLKAIFSHYHSQYDQEAMALLKTLQNKAGLAAFLQASIARGIIEPEFVENSASASTSGVLLSLLH